MNKGGRPQDPVWQFFVKLDNDTKVKCINCGSSVSSKIERLRTHHAKCSHVLSSGDSEPRQNSESGPSTSTANPTSDIQPSTSSGLPNSSQQPSEAPTSKKPRLLQPQMSGFTVATDNKMQQQLDQQVARFFYACNIPFAVAEQQEFKQLISMLRPGYRPPNRKAIGGVLLDNVYDSLQKDMAPHLKDKPVTLIQDGWSDIHNSPVIAHCIHTGSKAYFLSSDETGANKKTSDYCAELAKTAMSVAAAKYGCHVKAVVTDNEKKMLKMRDILHCDDESLVVYGCGAHWLNLLGQDITPSKVVSQIVEINKYFRNHHAAGSLLHEKSGSVKPQLPGDTRWNSQLDCIQTYLTNRPLIVLIIAEQDDADSVIDSHILKLISNIGLLNEAKNLHAQLQPVANALDRLQSDNASIADACEEWLKLLAAETLKPYATIVMKRFKEAVTDHHLLANLLHPTYKGKKLSEAQEEAARQLLLKLHPEHPEVIADLCAFTAGAEPFPPSLLSSGCVDQMSPILWWTSVSNCKSRVSRALINTAKQLLILPSSSAAIERVFSNFGLVQTKLRNQLGLEKASKLVSCYRELRGRTELDWQPDSSGGS